jgi:hypothetical protein
MATASRSQGALEEEITESDADVNEDYKVEIPILTSRKTRR